MPPAGSSLRRAYSSTGPARNRVSARRAASSPGGQHGRSDVGGQPERAERRHAAAPHAGRQGGHPPRRPADVAPSRVRPCPRERREDPERLPGPRARPADVDAVPAGRRPRLDPGRAERVGHPRGPAPGRTATRRSSSTRRLRRPRRRATGSRRSGRPCRTTRPLPRSRSARGERAEAAEHEVGPRARGVPPAEQGVVEDEHGHDPVVAVEGRTERRMVVDAQVAPVPEDRRGGHPLAVRTT